ncbi:HAD family hydrolase [Salinispira pacifica]
MSYKGVVFDFNGTLFWDTALHNRAWDIFLARHEIVLSNAEKHEHFHGKNNADIFAYLFPDRMSPELADRLAGEKESIYRDLCEQTEMRLAPGAPDLLDFLLSAGVRFTIATASMADNVDFYFEQLPLAKWFDRSTVVYNDGTMRGKPDPEIFLRALDKLDLPAPQVVIFEDSVSGIAAAEASGAGRIYIVNSNNEDYARFGHPQIRDFTEVPRELFG